MPCSPPSSSARGATTSRRRCGVVGWMRGGRRCGRVEVAPRGKRPASRGDVPTPHVRRTGQDPGAECVFPRYKPVIGCSGRLKITPLSAESQSSSRCCDSLCHRINVLENHIDTAWTSHAGPTLFKAPPAPGGLLAVTLLAEIGGRPRPDFPPTTCSRPPPASPPEPRLGPRPLRRFPLRLLPRLRQALVDFADGSRAASPEARDVYARARAGGLHRAHAIRVLARAWLRVTWRCWVGHLRPDDPARHEAALAARVPPSDALTGHCLRRDQSRRRFLIVAPDRRPQTVSGLAEGHPKGTGLDTDEDGRTLPTTGTTHRKIDMEVAEGLDAVRSRQPTPQAPSTARAARSPSRAHPERDQRRRRRLHPERRRRERLAWGSAQTRCCDRPVGVGGRP